MIKRLMLVLVAVAALAGTSPMASENHQDSPQRPLFVSLLEDCFPHQPCCYALAHRFRWYGICPSTRSVAQPSVKSTYSEPTVMWRLRNSDDGRRAFSVIAPQGSKATAGWFSQGIPQESREFSTWHGAIRWVEAKLVTLQLHGWHVDEPPTGKRRRFAPGRPK